MLTEGCTQEEIRFIICPEMIVSLLICEMMKDNECITLVGCERFSSYQGYAKSLEFKATYVDKTPKYAMLSENDSTTQSYVRE